MCILRIEDNVQCSQKKMCSFQINSLIARSQATQTIFVVVRNKPVSFLRVMILHVIVNLYAGWFSTVNVSYLFIHTLAPSLCATR